mmetsp:Transcript_41931/g.58618  ORF Transcript_41931/g.58618 Transcript_41931/m.58618 type:complete len:106 (+) Transcript_41931:1677-1994(+)
MIPKKAMKDPMKATPSQYCTEVGENSFVTCSKVRKVRRGRLCKYEITLEFTPESVVPPFSSPKLSSLLCCRLLRFLFFGSMEEKKWVSSSEEEEEEEEKLKRMKQ